MKKTKSKWSEGVREKQEWMEVMEIKRIGKNKVVKSTKSGRKANKIRIVKHQLNLDIMSLVTSNRAVSEKW